MYYGAHNFQVMSKWASRCVYARAEFRQNSNAASVYIYIHADSGFFSHHINLLCLEDLGGGEGGGRESTEEVWAVYKGRMSNDIVKLNVFRQDYPN